MNVIKLPTTLQLLRDTCAERGISMSFAKRAGLCALSIEQAREATGFAWLQGPAIEIPYRDSPGNESYARWKIFNHSSMRYVARAKSGSRVYFPAGPDLKSWAGDPSVPLYIVEGELKTLSAVENLKINAIGVSGVWNFVGRRDLSERATPLPDFDRMEWAERKVIVCFDSDWRTNIEVRRAVLALGVELRSRGADVYLLDLPSIETKKTGLDDWIVSAKRRGKSLIKQFEELPRIAFDPANFFDGYSELDFARRLHLHHSDRIRYVPELKTWFVLDQSTNVWRKDVTGQVNRFAKELPMILLREAQWVRSEDRRKEIVRAVASSGNKKRIDAALGLLQTEEGIPLLVEQMDRDPFLLALPDGNAVELKTGAVRPLRAGDYVTKLAGTTIAEPGTPAQNFLRFVDEIFLGDTEYIDYVKRALGYSLSGDTGEQCIFILHGIGANGKSTLLNILRTTLGAYATWANPETFMVQQSAGTRGDIVRLRGIRLVATSELEDGQRLAESIIKSWTGGEPMVARPLYAEPIEFAVTGKLFIATNHKPKVRGTDHAIWRRIHLWPFDLKLPKEKQDASILAKLEAEMPAILRWLVDGFAEWQRIGLRPPAKVVTATAAYRSESDVIGAWLGECCELEASEKTFGTNLYESYAQYAAAKREFCPRQRDFYRLLTERGFDSLDTTDRAKKEKGKFFVGIGLVKIRPPSTQADNGNRNLISTGRPTENPRTSKKRKF